MRVVKKTLWIEKEFSNQTPNGWLLSVIERLRGTYPRLVALTQGVKEDQLTHKIDDQWSLQEHVGHLADLEALHDGRIDDYIAKKDTLRPADMSNAQTNAACHNDERLTDLLITFKERRDNLISRLLSLPEDVLDHRALHPRLLIKMRPIDIAVFTAEHDDHHLAIMRTLIEKE